MMFSRQTLMLTLSTLTLAACAEHNRYQQVNRPGYPQQQYLEQDSPVVGLASLTLRSLDEQLCGNDDLVAMDRGADRQFQGRGQDRDRNRGRQDDRRMDDRRMDDRRSEDRRSVRRPGKLETFELRVYGSETRAMSCAELERRHVPTLARTDGQFYNLQAPQARSNNVRVELSGEWVDDRGQALDQLVMTSDRGGLTSLRLCIDLDEPSRLSERMGAGNLGERFQLIQTGARQY